LLHKGPRGWVLAALPGYSAGPLVVLLKRNE
jgi:hypothetical protein